MAILAAMPSISVLAVTARSINGGFWHGAMTAVGVAAGDVIYIAVAIFGLSFLTQILGDSAFVLRYLCGAYLLFLGALLWRTNTMSAELSTQANTPAASFLIGLLITLGDQKAIVFYLGFLPAFLDLEGLSLGDAFAVMGIGFMAVCGVKLIYAMLGDRFGRFVGSGLRRGLNRLAALLMLLVGLYLFASA